MDMGFYKKEVERIFKDNNIHYEWWMQDDFSVVVVVEWGDWKHDHRYLINLMNNNNHTMVERVITEEDGSDSFSAEYIFRHNSLTIIN